MAKTVQAAAAMESKTKQIKAFAAAHKDETFTAKIGRASCRERV